MFETFTLFDRTHSVRFKKSVLNQMVINAHLNCPALNSNKTFEKELNMFNYYFVIGNIYDITSNNVFG